MSTSHLKAQAVCRSNEQQVNILSNLLQLVCNHMNTDIVAYICSPLKTNKMKDVTMALIAMLINA